MVLRKMVRIERRGEKPERGFETKDAANEVMEEEGGGRIDRLFIYIWIDTDDNDDG